MENSIHFITNPGAIVGAGGINYDESIALNLRWFGPQNAGGNWNEPTVDYGVVSTSISSDFKSFNDGSATGIDGTVTNAFTSVDISTSNNSTTNFPDPIYDRGARNLDGDTGEIKLTGFPANTPIRLTAAIWMDQTVTANEVGTLKITDGANPMVSVGVNASTANEVVLEGSADGSGNFVIQLIADTDANQGVTNGCGIAAWILDYIS